MTGFFETRETKNNIYRWVTEP